MKPRALIVEDDSEIARVITDILHSLGHECVRAECVEEARSSLDGADYSYYLVDLEIPVHAEHGLSRVQNGINLIRELASTHPAGGKRIIAITSHGNDGPEQAVEVMKLGVADYVRKPFTFSPTGKTLDRAILEMLAKVESHRQQSKARRPIPPEELKPFDGGEMVFHADRVELCGVEICNSPRSGRRRKALDLFRRKKENGEYAAYSGKRLGELLAEGDGQNDAAGTIRDLRTEIMDALRDEAGVKCGRNDVILSGGRGYRLSPSVAVVDAGDGNHRRLQAHEHRHIVPDDPEKDPVNSGVIDPVPDTEACSGAAMDRHAWILNAFAQGRELRAPAIAEALGCSLATIKRDIDALKAEGKVEFVGSPRKGHYRLCDQSRGEAGHGLVTQ
ncbi:MAG: response regulator [Planctomycetaceae bacterium]